MTGLAYCAPRITATLRMLASHLKELESSAIDITTAGLAGVHSIAHGDAYDFGIRSDSDLSGLCYRYWIPWEKRFSKRFIRLKPNHQVAGKKYLQPVGEKPKLYFLTGTSPIDLEEVHLPVFLVEGEKKTLSLDRALRAINHPGLVIGIGGVWSWRCSLKELKPDGKLGKGKSRPIEDLDRIQWTARTVYLAFDADVITNWKVEVAERSLAQELSNRGAKVKLIRISGVA